MRGHSPSQSIVSLLTGHSLDTGSISWLVGDPSVYSRPNNCLSGFGLCHIRDLNQMTVVFTTEVFLPTACSRVTFLTARQNLSMCTCCSLQGWSFPLMSPLVFLSDDLPTAFWKPTRRCWLHSRDVVWCSHHGCPSLLRASKEAPNAGVGGEGLFLK